MAATATRPSRPVRGSVPPAARHEPLLAPGSFRLAEAALTLDEGSLGAALQAGLIAPPPGFPEGWLHASVEAECVCVELELPGGAPPVAGRVRTAGVLPGAHRTRQLLALVVAEANALLPSWRAARAALA